MLAKIITYEKISCAGGCSETFYPHDKAKCLYCGNSYCHKCIVIHARSHNSIAQDSNAKSTNHKNNVRQIDPTTLQVLLGKLEECRYRKSSSLTLPILEMLDAIKRPFTKEELLDVLKIHRFSEEKGFHTEPDKVVLMRDLEGFIGGLL
jgi:hypothetical protein